MVKASERLKRNKPNPSLLVHPKPVGPQAKAGGVRARKPNPDELQAELDAVNERITKGFDLIWAEEERIRQAGDDPNKSEKIGRWLEHWQKLVDRSHELIDEIEAAKANFPN